METKPLLFGLIGFFIGGLLVSVAATTLNKPDAAPETGMSMSQMTESLEGKQGDEFDEAFISGMIEHHQGAIDMARLAETSAKHDEIKQLSRGIVSAQKAEIQKMTQWQVEWNYAPSNSTETKTHSH